MNQSIIVILSIGGLLVSVYSTIEETEDSILMTGSVQLDTVNEDDSAILTAAAATSPETLECPSTNVVRVQYKCPGPSNSWTDCAKSHCCPGYNLINGRCISANINPCNLNLCEQRCAFIFQKVVCTCWDGYRFTSDKQTRSSKSMCIDIDECEEGIHDCQQICKNTPGSFICDCENGFALRNDNKTCMQTSHKLNGDDKGCVANCGTVQQLRKKVSKLQEKLTALEIAVSLSIHGGAQFSARPGSPGQPGPPGSPGSPGLPGIPGLPGSRGASKSDELHQASTAYTDEMTDGNSHSILDSFIQTNVGYCKCQRGPIGPQGPAGTAGQKGAMGGRGPRGTKGATGNLDFLLLILADIRYDITLLQERIFPGETLPKFDFDAVVKKHRSIVDTKMEENNHSDDIKNFQASESIRISDFTPEDGFSDSSGDELDHYEE